MSEKLKNYIALAAEAPLTRDQADKAFTIIMNGEATDAQIGGFLMTLRTRGESIEEYSAAANVMRLKCKAVNAPIGAIDIVGTGGDGKSTLNISTATALVTAGADVVVAKHGNRNLSSKSGASDALSQSGVNIMVEPDVVEKAIQEIGIGFMMAPMHHPAVKHVMPARLDLGTRTIFNILGPLTNPAGVKRQLTGAFNRSMLRPMAEVLRELGSEKAWLVHGSDGTDEISISGISWVVELKSGEINEFEIHPENAGLPVHPFESIIGGTPEYNAAEMAKLLDGQKSAYRDAVVLNTAAALVVADKANSLLEGAEIAITSIDSGSAKSKLSALASITSGAK